jgi:hypothetical protein
MPRIGLLFLLALLACRNPAGADQSGAGRLEAHWSDSAGTAVSLFASAEAYWCARDTLLEILALRNDTAVGIAVYVKDTVRAEGYPVFRAAFFSPFRPQATAALRLLTPTELRSFESIWGQVILSKADSLRVSGSFDLHLKRQSAGDSLQLTGRFTRLAIRPAAVSCGRANKPPHR